MSIIEGRRPYDVYLTTRNDTFRTIAKKVKCSVEDLMEPNRDQQWMTDIELTANTILKDGTTVLLPFSAEVSAQKAKGYRGSDALKWVDPCMCFAVIKRNIDKGLYDGDDGASCLPQSLSRTCRRRSTTSCGTLRKCRCPCLARKGTPRAVPRWKSPSAISLRLSAARKTSRGYLLLAHQRPQHERQQ